MVVWIISDSNNTGSNNDTSNSNNTGSNNNNTGSNILAATILFMIGHQLIQY